MIPLYLIGSSGHAKMAIDAALATKKYEVVGLLDDSHERLGGTVLGVPVVGPATRETVRELGVRHALIAIGSNRARVDLVERLGDLVTWETILHPTAYLAREVKIGEGTIVAAGVVVQPCATIGKHAILNTSCSVDHDGEVGDFAHVGPGVRLAGACRVDRGVLLGVGACVHPGRIVGKWSIVGAGGVVIHDVPEKVTAIGVPARWKLI